MPYFDEIFFNNKKNEKLLKYTFFILIFLSGCQHVKMV